MVLDESSVGGADRHGAVGRTYAAPEPYLVGREKIREFADAIGASDAAHRDPEAAAALDHPDVIAPPTFPVLLAMPASAALCADLGIDMAHVVHGDQRFTYTRPVRAGDRLVSVTTVEKIMARAGNQFLTTRTDVTTEAGEPVVAVWSRLVVRGGESRP
jgi:acyl dehydratase